MEKAASLPALSARPDLQGMRAAAVCMVILGHGHVPGFRGGFVGVDVFFVISGFVISSSLLHEATSTGRVRIAAFYARRARRLLPAAGLVLATTVMTAAVVLPLSQLRTLATDVRWSVFFLANVHFSAEGTDYFDQTLTTSPVQHMWSLAVEEQFYLVWPLALLLTFWVARRRLLVTRVVVGVAWATSLTWSVLLTPRSPVAAYFSSGTRAWELATGALLALWGHRLTRLPHRVRLVLVGFGILAVLVAVARYDASTPFPGWHALLPVAGTAALLAAGASGPVGAARLLALRPVRYVGDISYSLYLWHWPVLVVGTSALGRQPRSWVTAGLIGLVAAASVLSYHLVENPIRRQGVRALVGLRSLTLWPAVVGLVLATSGVAGNIASDRFEQRIHGRTQAASLDRSLAVRQVGTGVGGRHRLRLPDPDVGALIGRALRDADLGRPIPFPLANFSHLSKDIWQDRFHCYASFDQRTTRICPLGEVGAGRTVVVYGDSHAGMWLPALDLLGRRSHFRVVPLIKLGCGPFDVVQLHLGASMPTCPPFRKWALGRLQVLRPSTVVVAYRSLLEVVPGGGQSVEQAWRAGAERSLREIGATGARVEVLSDITSLDFSPADCLTAPRSVLASCTQRERPEALTGNALTHDAARVTGAHFADVTTLVCRRGRCPLVVDGVITYRDAWHITRTWSRVLASEVGRRLHLR